MKFEQEKKFNPSKSSPLSGSIEFEKSDTEKKIDKITGEQYFKKEDMQMEYFISLLSKGILHVSDVIKKDGQYFSRQMPLENITPVEDYKIEAELFLLKYLFGDDDHNISSDRNIVKNNVGQFSHYDYDRAFSSSTINNHILTKKPGEFLLKRDMKNDIKKIKSEIDDAVNMEEFYCTLKDKLNLFQSALENNDFFGAILKKSELQVTGLKFTFLKNKSEEDRKIELRKYLLDRVLFIKNTLD